MTETRQDRIRRTIAEMLRARDPDKTVCPSEVARSIAGQNEQDWRKLMAPIRDEAVRLADAGKVTIRRKGRVVDPHDFKGIYRLGRPAPREDTDTD